MLLNRPVYEAPLPTGRLLLMNPRISFAIGQRRGITMKQSEHVAFNTDQISVKFTARGDSNLLDTTVNSAIVVNSITSADDS